MIWTEIPPKGVTMPQLKALWRAQTNMPQLKALWRAQTDTILDPAITASFAR